MKIKKIYPILILLILLIALFCLSSPAFAYQLPKVRVYYVPPSGEIWITYFLSEACSSEESETACMDKISKQNGMENVPYDDMSPSELPDRTYRNKWRGEKGKGIWIDYSLVTRNDKIREFNKQIDEELDKEQPDITKVSKLERLLEKIQDIDHPVLTAEDLAGLEPKKKSLIASVIDSTVEFFSDVVSKILTGLEQGFLAIKSLFVEEVQIGTSQSPAGITVYDFNTGKPYCIIVRNGKIENIPGECTTSPIEQPQEQPPTVSPENSAPLPENPTPTENPPPPEETAPSTEPTPTPEPEPAPESAPTEASEPPFAP